MSAVIASKLSSKGRITIPRKIRERLGVRTGEKIAFQEVTHGVVILSKAPLSRPQIAEYLLKSLVLGIGPEAEKLGLRQEEDLDPVIEAIREQSFRERYGTAKATSGLC